MSRDVLSVAEKNELITGVKAGFQDVNFIGRFLDQFIEGVRYRTKAPIDVLFELIDSGLKDISEEEALRVIKDEGFRNSIRKDWQKEMSKNRLRGQTISNIAAVCIEAHLQSGTHFKKGEGTNDLQRVRDGSRWEIKGSRSNSLKLTINQSHVGIDETIFLVYCGYPEENKLHGIFYLQGNDEYFTPRATGRNMRQLMKDFYSQAVQIWPE